MVQRKIVLFGGTFDPIHLGHTTVAAAAAEHIGAEAVVFIPAKCSPLKDRLPEASDDDRLQMIALAVADNKNFQLSGHELRKPEPSYTLETVRQFQSDYGSDTSIYWLIGADNVDDLPRWYRIVELIDECNLAVMYSTKKLKENIIETPLIDISSTEIRNRLAAGRDVTDMLCPLVADHIRKHNLYQSKSKP